MTYLLVNHIPAHRGDDAAHLRLPAAWARDLAAAGRSARDAGVRLIVATPTTTAPAPADAVAVVPDALGFEHVALPYYDSARSFLRVRGDVAAQLAMLAGNADVVQLDHGGHPMPLGVVADPIVRASHRPALWVISGDRAPDPHVAQASRSVTKRAVGRTLDSRVRRSLGDALRSAARVVTTDASVAIELHRRWSVDAEAIEAIDVSSTDLVGEATVNQRHDAVLDATRPLRIATFGEQTIDRGTQHVMAAMHRCWRLRAPITLVASAGGGEATAVRRQAAELGLADCVRLVDDIDLDDVDVIVDAALCNASRVDLDVHVSNGLAPIAYAPRRASPGVMALPRGAVDALADALFAAATDRRSLAARMLAGVAWARARTLDVAYRRRFEIAAELAARSARGAA